MGGVALHGGFAGTESWLHERDPVAHPTILSGDIGTSNNPDDNVYHVLTAGSAVTETAVLEGVIIAGGNADGNGDNGLGGGLLNQGGSPTLVNVSFVGNAANRGGGVYNAEGGSPALVNVAFSGNSAETEGGGLYSMAGQPGPDQRHLQRQQRRDRGRRPVQRRGQRDPTLTNAIVWGNDGGQIANDGAASVDYSDVEGGLPGDGQPER